MTDNTDLTTTLERLEAHLIDPPRTLLLLWFDDRVTQFGAVIGDEELGYFPSLREALSAVIAQEGKDDD